MVWPKLRKSLQNPVTLMHLLHDLSNMKTPRYEWVSQIHCEAISSTHISGIKFESNAILYVLSTQNLYVQVILVSFITALK